MADIAACYEYIVPRILIDELFLRSDDYELVSHLADLLGELATLERGIPQMLQASDRLADLYLSIVDRSLARVGLRWSRTADDYKIVVPTWERASSALALLDKEVRAIGLILSANKTRTVAVGPKARARSSSSPESDDELDFEDDDEEEEVMPPVEAILEWHGRWKEARRNKQRIDPPPTRELRGLNSSDRVSADLLADLVFAYPPHLEYVVGAIVKFATASSNDDGLVAETLARLVSQTPHTPWNTLWLLEGASRLSSLKRFATTSQIRDLAKDALIAETEIVRAQAAWFLAKYDTLSAEQLRTLHMRASPLTLTGVSAVAAVASMRAPIADRATLTRIAGAIRAGQSLNSAAVIWAKSNA